MMVPSIRLAFTWLVFVASVNSVQAGRQGIELRTDRTSYISGDWARLRLMNRGRGPIGPGDSPETLLCRPKVHQKVGDSWQLAAELEEVCPLIGRPGLAPGGTVERRIRVVPALFASPGDYRFGVTVVDTESGNVVPCFSNVITVAANPSDS